MMLTALLFATVMHAAAPAGEAPVCHELRAAIAFEEKELSTIAVDETTDNSAPRATMRATQSTQALTEIYDNVQLMAEQRCAPYPRAISAYTYIVSSRACREAIEKAVATTADGAPPAFTPTPECDRSKWTPPAP